MNNRTSPPKIRSRSIRSRSPRPPVLDQPQRRSDPRHDAGEPGETSTITVTATDSVNQTTTSQSFTVTVGAYAGPSSTRRINFRPFAESHHGDVPRTSRLQVQLDGQSGYPDTAHAGDTLTYHAALAAAPTARSPTSTRRPAPSPTRRTRVISGPITSRTRSRAPDRRRRRPVDRASNPGDGDDQCRAGEHRSDK